MLAKGSTSESKAINRIIGSQEIKDTLIFSNDRPNKTIAAEILPTAFYEEML